jgi:hypothetical protein
MKGNIMNYQTQIAAEIAAIKTAIEQIDSLQLHLTKVMEDPSLTDADHARASELVKAGRAKIFANYAIAKAKARSL